MAETLGSFGTFVPPVKENPYKETFVEFAKASEANPDAAWIVEIDAAKEITERIAIAEAANAIGKTARLRDRDDSQRTQVGTREKSGNPIYSGRVTLTFTLSPMHAQRRGKNADGTDIVEATEEPVEKPAKK